MYDIDEQELKKSVGNVIYAKGLDLYLRNKVRSIEGLVEEDFLGETIKINSVVESDYTPEVYNVKVSVRRSLDRVFFGCDCEFPGNKKEMCKHTVATLLKWSREKEIIMRKIGITSAKTTQFIDYFTRNLMVEEESYKRELNMLVRLEFTNDNRRGSAIDLRIGEDKTYVVKNMREFLKLLQSKDSTLVFGKGFTFDPTVHTFRQGDKPIIDLLLEVYETDEMLIGGAHERYWGGPLGALSGKHVYLTDRQVKRVLELLETQNLDIKLEDNSYSGVPIIQGDMPLEFDISIAGSSLVINQEEKPYPITEDGEYFFFRGAVYHASSEQRKAYMPFHNEMAKSKKKNVTFPKYDIDKLASYVIPTLKNISRSVRINKSLEKNLYEEELKIVAYVDKEGEDVTCDVVFKYGEKEINPINDKGKDESEKILIRDITRELKFISALKGFGFKLERLNYKLIGEDYLLDFLAEGISKLQELAEVYYSESFKNMKIYTSSHIKSSIRLNNEDLLEFTFNIEGVDKKELRDVLNALRQKKKYYKLKKGGFVSLQDRELQAMGNMIEYLDIKDSDLEKERVLLAKYNALYIDQAFKASNIIGLEKNKRFRELVNNIKEIKDMDFSVPEHLDSIMRGYQKFGFKWLKTLSSCGFGGILADEMGLGKTLQTIAFIESEVIENKDERKPCLVVAPTSLVYNWLSEVEKFAPNLKALVISGSKDEREEKRKEIEEADIIITSYPLIRRDIEDYKEIKFRYCILDEAQQIKNPASINAQSVKELKAEGYFALTGTPIENSLTELWSIFDFIMPGYLLNHNKFLRKYETPIVKDKNATALEELNKHVKPFILRRLKKDVVKELPPKIEHKLIVEMTEEQKKLYAAYVAEAKNEVSSEINEKGFNRSKIKILSILTRLRQICCDPSTFVQNYDGESGKLLALDELLEDSIGEGHRILLFSQFTSVLKNIKKRFEASGIEYMYLDGQTKVEDRGRMVREFNEGKGSIFLISLKAGGTGLNLTGADVVIHFDPWWNPAVEDQATDRAHRIGQQKTVEVIKLVAQGTIEEKIYNLQEKKKDIIKSVMGEEGTEESLISQMTQEELEELFKI
jgi:SNF2 family DNA or RNA helicase